MEPIFILGCVRSGTTLIRSILSSHPLIHIPRETDYFNYVLEYKKMNSCDQLNRETAMDFFHWFTSKRRFTYQGLDKSKLWEKIVQSGEYSFKGIFICMMQILADSGNKPHWGEKTPGNEKNIALIQNIFPNAKFVFMIRDPRSVSSSLKRVPWGSNRITSHIKIWRRSIKAYEKNQHKNILLVKYESLVSNTENIVQLLCDFLNIEYLPLMITQRKDYQNFKKEDNWTAEYENRVIEDIRSDHIVKWKKNLAKVEIKTIEICSEPYFSKYDYHKSSGKNNLFDLFQVIYFLINDYGKEFLKSKI